MAKVDLTVLLLLISQELTQSSFFNFSRTCSASAEGRPKQAACSTGAVTLCCSGCKISSSLRSISVVCAFLI